MLIRGRTGYRGCVLSRFRTAYGLLLAPLARLLLKAGASPTAVTVAGTVAVVLSALLLFPGDHLVAGSVACGLFLLADGLDGTMARLGNRETKFGAFLDSTLDRVADGAIFVGLAAWGIGRSPLVSWLAMLSLVAGFIVSYARARAEAEGWNVSVGLFERTDRLVVALAAALIAGFGAGESALVVGLAVVLAGSVVTTGQRIAAARRASLPPREPERPSSSLL
ncbi:CDP-diacylglycerol--glycerol-3-phosphate 3-phosphatidyltransferase [Tessaracoccus bendigoensis DSM 12906]|uniref:Phosphatidylinositol phosphate synthase n=1 Tax=Tessaracoccus bendigoensis DSM 12906 TaxID=1123357 RepID=A0A1M6NUM3_9ACTN|nr:CDP-diacylglycerol--glycerol-3-phosphate 3-phosphatidyltransferase [Tessaracoccus bendigoensis DSM 12906]